MIYRNLSQAMNMTKDVMNMHGETIKTERWQGTELGKDNASQMVEYLHHSFSSQMPETVMDLAEHCQPNLPWADDHFEERVCGQPFNPGVEYKNWPWASAAEKHRPEQFNHNYMERYWPQYAGVNPDGCIMPSDRHEPPLHGIRHPYGDLAGLVRQLAHEPDTRQAYLPVWFPEDTGDSHNGRKPCTLGYHFIMRNGKLDITYYIRSCDLFRHFNDDVYMTIRLAMFVLDEAQRLNPKAWGDVTLGRFNMHITSMHMFLGDFNLVFKRNPGA